MSRENGTLVQHEVWSYTCTRFAFKETQRLCKQKGPLMELITSYWQLFTNKRKQKQNNCDSWIVIVDVIGIFLYKAFNCNELQLVCHQNINTTGGCIV